MNKMQELLQSEGFTDDMEYMQSYGNESVVPGICTNEGCDYTNGVEPDQTEGWCEICETQTVKSGMILLGVI